MSKFFFLNHRKEPVTVSIELWAVTYELAANETIRVEYRPQGHQLTVEVMEDGSIVVGVFTDQIRIFVREKLEYETQLTDKID